MNTGETEIRIGEADERDVVHFRGPSVIPGYWEDEGATASSSAHAVTRR